MGWRCSSARARSITCIGSSAAAEAKELLRSKGIDFEEIDVTDNDEERKRLVELTGLRTVPQIFINGKSVGGYDQLLLLVQSGELDKIN